MLSVRARMINGVLRVARWVGADRRADAALADRASLDRLLRTVRRFDAVDPPRRLRRRWRHEQLAVAGSALHLLERDAGGPRRVLLYFHGGGYMVGPAKMHWKAAAEVARGGRADLAMLIYPKTPEHDHRATIAAAVEAYELLVSRYGSDNVVVGGDSAGGGLVATLLSVLRERGVDQPRAAILISPWLDVSMSDPASRAQADTDLMLTIEGAIAAGRYYAADRATTDALVSPRFAATSGFAPMHLFVGTEEIFLADCLGYAEKARANGDPVTLRVMAKGQHVAAIFSTPEGRIARAQMLALIDWP
ncbi:MAG: alpha/beta hydrolase [Acidimicrobiales bacterium]